MVEPIVADDVEDYASLAGPVVDKTARVLVNFRYVTAVELMTAAQACDLRPTIRLGDGTARLHALIRTVVPSLTEDRPTGPDIETLSNLIAQNSLPLAGEGRVWAAPQAETPS